MNNLVELYCHIDDYCQVSKTQLKTHLIEYTDSKQTRNRSCKISLSEIITILVLFHQIRFREFKAYYNELRFKIEVQRFKENE